MAYNNGMGGSENNLSPRQETHLRLHVLASGSKGNCSLVENVETGMLVAIDCGISWKAFRTRCAECNVDSTRVGAVLVTHEHTDHTKGLGVMMRGLARLGATPPLYVSEAVHEASSEIRTIEDAVDLRHFAAGDMLSLCGIDTFAFRTSHDAAESFGFRFNRSNDAIGFMTDTGIATGESLEALTDCRVLALEANHDLEMLANGPYPSFLKARITGSRGHLSNVQGAELLESLLDNRLESVVAMHVSQVNDTYGLAGSALASALERNCHPACSFVSYQEVPVSIG